MSKAAEPNPEKMRADYDAALREGRHSDRFQTVCDGCDQWVSGIYHVTLQHDRLCYACADKAGLVDHARSRRATA